MKCSNPLCNRGIGLVAHRHGWFSKRRYCSRQCRDNFVSERPNPSQQERNALTYFHWITGRGPVCDTQAQTSEYGTQTTRLNTRKAVREVATKITPKSYGIAAVP